MNRTLTPRGRLILVWGIAGLALLALFLLIGSDGPFGFWAG